MTDETPEDIQHDLVVLSIQLMADIRHQIFTGFSGAMTVAQCHCGAFSRGGRECYTCLTRKLGYIVGNKIARDYLNSCLAQRECELRVHEAASKGT